MVYTLKKDGTIKNPWSLIIDPDVIYWENTKFSNINATSNGAFVGSDLIHLQLIQFDKAMRTYKPLQDNNEDKHFFQAEVLVEKHIPLKYIKKEVSMEIRTYR